MYILHTYIPWVLLKLVRQWKTFSGKSLRTFVFGKGPCTPGCPLCSPMGPTCQVAYCSDWQLSLQLAVGTLSMCRTLSVTVCYVEQHRVAHWASVCDAEHMFLLSWAHLWVFVSQDPVRTATHSPVPWSFPCAWRSGASICPEINLGEVTYPHTGYVWGHRFLLNWMISQGKKELYMCSSTWLVHWVCLWDNG